MKEEDKKEESSEDYVSEFSKVFKKIDAIKTLEQENKHWIQSNKGATAQAVNVQLQEFKAKLQILSKELAQD